MSCPHVWQLVAVHLGPLALIERACTACGAESAGLPAWPE